MSFLSKRSELAGLHVSADEQQYLTFRLQDSMYAIDILYIKEILEFSNVTSIPLMPDFIKGVINLRGAVVPVIDLAVRFGAAQSQLGKRSCIVIIEVHSLGGIHILGIVVDAVSAVIEINQANIEPAPAIGAQIRTEFIHGMGKVDNQFVIILQVDKVLAVEEMTLVSHLNTDADPMVEQH